MKGVEVRLQPSEGVIGAETNSSSQQGVDFSAEGVDPANILNLMRESRESGVKYFRPRNAFQKWRSPSDESKNLARLNPSNFR